VTENRNGGSKPLKLQPARDETPQRPGGPDRMDGDPWQQPVRSIEPFATSSLWLLRGTRASDFATVADEMESVEVKVEKHAAR